MQILITGSEGLIGKALRRALEKMNIQVIGFDYKLKASHPEYGDILNIEQLKQAISGCDGIIHLAAISRVVWGEQHPALCWQTNFKGTSNVIMSAKDAPQLPWLIYASSREVYGRQSNLPVKEDTPLQPVNIYGYSKAAAERIVLKARSQDLNTAVIRFSNVYGCHFDHSDRVIPAFCSAASKGEILRVDGSNNTFDFTHLSDVVKGIIQVIERLCDNQRNLPHFHFTTGQPTSLRRAAELANAAGGFLSTIVEAPSRTFDVAHFYGDASHTRNFLGWHPSVLIEEGINSLVDLFKERNASQNASS